MAWAKKSNYTCVPLSVSICLRVSTWSFHVCPRSLLYFCTQKHTDRHSDASMGVGRGTHQTASGGRHGSRVVHVHCRWDNIPSSARVRAVGTQHTSHNHLPLCVEGIATAKVDIFALRGLASKAESEEAEYESHKQQSSHHYHCNAPVRNCIEEREGGGGGGGGGDIKHCV